ncbi:hypothetical protein Tco_0184826 [Tanacetum coccineum]
MTTMTLVNSGESRYRYRCCYGRTPRGVPNSSTNERLRLGNVHVAFDELKKTEGLRLFKPVQASLFNDDVCAKQYRKLELYCFTVQDARSSTVKVPEPPIGPPTMKQVDDNKPRVSGERISSVAGVLILWNHFAPVARLEADQTLHCSRSEAIHRMWLPELKKDLYGLKQAQVQWMFVLKNPLGMRFIGFEFNKNSEKALFTDVERLRNSTSTVGSLKTKCRRDLKELQDESVSSNHVVKGVTVADSIAAVCTIHRAYMFKTDCLV